MLPTRRRLGRLVTTLAIAAAPLVAVAATPSAAHATTDDCGVAGNLVTNCGFEGGFTDWATSPAGGGSLFGVGGPGRSGTSSVYFAAVSNQDDTISQTLAGTVPGQSYTVSLWDYDYYNSGAHLAATVIGAAGGDVTIVDTTNLPEGTWTQYTASFTAGSSAPVLAIGGYHGPSEHLVDDVSVVSDLPVLPSTVPAGTYGVPYSTSVAPTGGTPPYTISLASGSLPAGLTIDTTTGVISGTPTAAGDASFTIDVSDSAGVTGTAEQAYTLSVAKADPTVTVIDPVVGGVVGEGANVDATSTSTEGSMSFLSDTPATCDVSGPSVTYLHSGTCTIEAAQAASADFNAASGTTTVNVSAAATTTAVHVHAGSISADVAVVAPGAGDPTGTVTFSVGGDVVGTAPVANHTATLTYQVPTGATRQVAAVYGGDADFTGSSDSTSRNDPSISASVTSAHPATGYGWYHSPMTVRFTCTTDGAALTHACPAPVTIDHDVAGRSVTRTILATDGGADTVTVTGLNLDQHAPAVRVTGVRDGAVYNGRAPAAHCVATDGLSGVASCRIARHTDGSVTSYVATARDRAGNTARTRGSFRVLSTYLVGAPFRNGAFQVRRQVYSLVTRADTRPHYVYAAPAPARPSGGYTPFTRTGPHTWAITVSLAGLPHDSRWNLGVKVGSTLRVVTVHVR